MLTIGDVRLGVVDMDGTRIDRLLVTIALPTDDVKTLI